MNDMDVPGATSTKTASVLNVIAGLWLLISPFVLGFSAMQTATWDTAVVGVIVLVLAWTRAANPARYVGLSVINLLLGVWLIVSPFVLAYSTSRPATWNDVVFGIVVAILAIWSAVATPTMPLMARR
jgi:uncharacterized membrane protein HdeD (DUF308 family)